MKRIACTAIALALAASCDARAVGNLASVVIIDRDNGTELCTYYSRGEYWVAGKPGSRYAIEIRNRSGDRLLAVTSVDGVNVISGDTAGWEQTGYVFDPGERYRVTGWRKSSAEVAAFTFTPAPNSYAARTGRAANIGIIGVALFRESRPQAFNAPPKIAPSAPESGLLSKSAGGAENQLAEPSAPSADGTRVDDARANPEARESVAAATTAAPKLGTGHGEREHSYVTYTNFQRMQSEPNEVIRIRYDSFEHLVAMGIVRPPRLVPPVPNPFPSSVDRQFVPDPPG